MNAMLAKPVLPNPPPRPNLGGSRPFLDWVEGVHRFFDNLRRSLGDTLGGIVDQVDSAVQGVGAPIASAATIMPDHPIHHVTGTAAITTIVAPSGFSGPIWLIADAAWTLAPGGNIAMALAPTVGQAVMVVYDPATKMWYVG